MHALGTGRRGACCAAVAGVLLATAVGCSGGEGDDEGSGGAACAPELGSIQATIFVPACSGAGCHSSPEPAAALDLGVEGLEARLVGAASATCDRALVVPGNPELSFLYEKVSSATPTCGQAMPIGGALPAPHQDCIRGWIESLSGGCELCGGSSCVDLETDALHCGSCDRACPAGAPCEGGSCACLHGGTECDATCVDTKSDPEHCGSCTKKCPPALVCSLGQCSATCAGGLTQCGSACVDTASDPANCGGCAQGCGPTGECAAGECSCGAGIDTQTDPLNCGGCGVVCATGQACEAGSCTCGTASVSFSQAVLPILTANCATNGCHKGAMPQEGLDLTAASAWQELVGVPASQCKDGRQRVLPGKPEESYLVDKIQNVDLCAGTKMPKLKTLPDAAVETVVNWICAGAPDN